VEPGKPRPSIRAASCVVEGVHVDPLGDRGVGVPESLGHLFQTLPPRVWRPARHAPRNGESPDVLGAFVHFACMGAAGFEPATSRV
jgi:hypothetical protein